MRGKHMNLEKADYGTVLEMGTWSDFEMKLRMMGQRFDDVVSCVDESGVSLLERCLVARKFELAKLFLERNAAVNVITKEGQNEFHLIAANIRFDGALEVARLLLERGVSLTLQDKKYKNSALFTLCCEIFKVRTPEHMEFLATCIGKVQKADLDVANRRGITLRQFIRENGPDEIKKIVEERT